MAESLGEIKAGNPPFLTVIVPVFNEEENLARLHERLTGALRTYGKSYELLFVDDGSRDDSPRRLAELHRADPHVRVVRFVRNFGQQMAVSAGLRHARGSVMVLLDADLQTAPEEIPLLVEKLGEGYDLVYGVRTRRVDPLWRRAGSFLMSKLLYRVTGIDVPDSASGFIALSRPFVESINLFNEKTKYFSGLFAWLSYGRWAMVPVSHAARTAGHSKYNVRRLVSLTLTFVCNFSVEPLRLAMYLGAPLLALSIFALGFLLIARAVGGPWTEYGSHLILAAVALFSAVQLICVGILGEYLARIYREVKEQPSFVIREVLDHEPAGVQEEPADALVPLATHQEGS